MRRLRDLLLALLLTALSADLLASEVTDAEVRAGEADVAARVRLLSASPHPDAWLLGAWMARSWCRGTIDGCNAVQAGLLFERVLAQLPDNPVVLRVLIDQLPVFLTGDPARLAGERARLLARVQSLDPDSLASWLPALPDLADSADPKTRALGAAMLARAALSTRASTDFREAYRWIVGRLPAMPLDPEWLTDGEKEWTPDTAHRLLAISLVHAIATPSYEQVTRWCAYPASAWVADCRAIARVLAGGETLLDRAIAKGMLERLVSTADERAEAERVGARADWLMAAMVHCPVLDDAAMLAAMEQEGVTEIALIEAGLQARGLPIEPPSDPALRKRPCGDSAQSSAVPL